MRVSDLRPGWRTDFILHRGSGAQVLEHDDCIVVRTPGNPGFYWGNCLVLADTPSDDDLPHWLQRFADEVVAGRPEVRHLALGINTPYADQQRPAWVAAGLTLHVNAVMRLLPGQAVAPAQAPRGAAVVRAIDWRQDLPALVDLECADTHGHHPDDYRRYRERQFALMRPLHEQGLLQWFGLWCDGTLAASCGLMREHDKPGATARFQHVGTHPQWRRRGLCTALVAAVTDVGLHQWQAAELVMVADPTDVAIGIYRSLGFQAFEREWLWQRNAPQDHAA